MFSGTLDSVVKTAVMDDLKTYYQSYVPAANVVYKKDIASEHAMVTDDYGSGCSVKGAPYINDCNYDLAGAMLQHIYGPLNARNNAALSGTFTEFDQTAFVSGHGMATTGWVYAPQACTTGAQCKVHVVLHGCKQNTADVGQQYVRNTGYNRWADTNNSSCCTPKPAQPRPTAAGTGGATTVPTTPKNLARKWLAIKAMVDQLSSGSAPSNLPPPNGVATSGATTNSMVITLDCRDTARLGYNVYRNGTKANALPVVTAST